MATKTATPKPKRVAIYTPKTKRWATYNPLKRGKMA